MGLSRLFKKKDEPKVQDNGDVSFDDLEKFSNLRETAYCQLFGSDFKASHEFEIKMPHIYVYIFPPRKEGRPFYTLVSGGMSDFPMRLPIGVDQFYARREIILYCDTPDDDLINLVRFFAHYPFQNATWLGPGHTVPNGVLSRPLFENSTLTGTYFMETILESDRHLGETLVFQGAPVQFLWMVPITRAEMNLKVKKGADALMDLFEQHKHPLVLNKHRTSYI